MADIPLLRTLKRLFVPGGLVLLAAAAILQRIPAPASMSWRDPAFWRDPLQMLPWLIFAGGILLGCGFRRSRIVFAILALALSEQALIFARLEYPIHPSRRLYDIPYDAIAILLPLNLAYFAHVKERGFLTTAGLSRMAGVLFQGLLAGLVWRYHGWRVAALLHNDVFHFAYRLAIPISQMACLSFFAAFVLLLIHFFRRPNGLNAAFFWALVAVFLGLSGNSGRGMLIPGSPLYFSIAQFILVLALLMMSYAMAYRDDLTNLPSRRALNEALLLLGHQYVMAMVDIDHFKKFNDQYGHDVGDQVLRMVAAKLAAVKGGGKAYRYGGEEFTIIFNGKSADEAIERLEPLRKAIAQTEFIVRGPHRPRKLASGQPRPAVATTIKRTRVTVSMGVAQSSIRYRDPQKVIQAADRALYRAKSSGRNRISE